MTIQLFCWLLDSAFTMFLQIGAMQVFDVCFLEFAVLGGRAGVSLFEGSVVPPVYNTFTTTLAAPSAKPLSFIDCNFTVHSSGLLPHFSVSCTAL